ncbi:MAG: FtsQ-type POTRA domain-containing protein [Chloroflexota bacterium]
MARRRTQRGTSYTGIIRSDRSRTIEDRNTPSQIEQPKGFNWRIVSGFMILLLSGVLALFFVSDVFYVSTIRVGGVDYIGVEEIFTYSDIADFHIFWVTPDEVAENVMAYPSIADADVRIGWPPNMVTITIEEREPALIWEQDGIAYWVDVQGNVMDQREERDDLVRVIVDDPAVESPVGTSEGLADDIVFGVLQLHDLRPDIMTWRYHPIDGLGWRNANGWDVWLGTGTNMDEKLRIYDAQSASLIARGVQPGVLNIVNPDAPYYTVLWGR